MEDKKENSVEQPGRPPTKREQIVLIVATLLVAALLLFLRLYLFPEIGAEFDQ